MSNKDTVLEAVQHLPDELTFEDIIEHLTILAAIRRAEEDADADRVHSHDEVKNRIASWISK